MSQRLLRVVDGFVVGTGVVSLGFLVCFAFTQVIARYVFSHALPWPEELCRFLFIALAYVGIALTMRDKRHLCVDLLLTCTSARTQKMLKVFSLVCSTAFLFFLGYLAYEMMWDVREMHYMASSMPIPIFVTWIPIPLYLWMTAFYGVLNIIDLLKTDTSR